MDRPRVVMVAGKLPEPVRGGLDLRISAQLAALAELSEVTLLAISGKEGEVKRLSNGVQAIGLGGVKDVEQHVLVQHVLAHPADPYGPIFSTEVAAALQSQLRRLDPDVVVVSRLQSWIYADAIRSATPVPVILDLDESAARLHASFPQLPYSGLQRSMHLRFTRATARYEQEVIYQPDALWVSSGIERDFVLDRYPGVAPVNVVVNAVSIPEGEGSHEVPLENFEIVFPANFAYPPNLLAAREINEQIAPLIPQVGFLLAGANAPESLSSGLSGNVTLLSPVQDMTHLLTRASAAVMPIRAGAGTRLKVLECLAWGVPVVGTSFAFEGIAVRAGQEVLLANTPGNFVDGLKGLMKEPELFKSLKKAGKRLVEEEHSVAAVGRQIQSSFQQLGLPGEREAAEG